MMQTQSEVNKLDQGGPKKQKIWGPVQPVRQSSRIDRSKHIMDKAMELKEKKNSMIPSKKMSGIMSSNPFHVIQNPELLDMSSKLGVSISEIAVSAYSSSCSDPPDSESLKNDDKISSGIHGIIYPIVDYSEVVDHRSEHVRDVCESSSHLDNSFMTPKQYNIVMESDEIEDNIWIDVYNKKKRGKHPRRLFK
jgi:hypothetical protein